MILSLRRAVARLSVLSELCIPLVKVGGQFVAMKAAAAQDELNDAKKALSILGAEKIQEYSFTLPVENSESSLFVFNKVKALLKNIRENLEFQIKLHCNIVFHVEH